MDEPQDPDRTLDTASAPADSLDAGLAAAFGRPADAPRSVLSELRCALGSLRPVLLVEAEGESALVVKPRSDAMPAPERTGSRYQLSGEIARGGMGAVLRGRDVDLGRDLAVKVLLEKYANRPEVTRRFVEEAQICGQLQHPGIVPVYDIGHFGDRPFFTMKLVKGKTLAALLGERSEPAADKPRLLSIALQVAHTLAYAHAKGVIHRDLKPANIMVGAFGEVQVMDWGLAKVLAAGGIADEEKSNRSHQPRDDVTTIRTARSSGSAGSFGTATEAGSLLGTPAYMPPEQANGDIAHLDRRADVFGLGAIVCEILTGQPPYVGRSFEEVRRKASSGDLAEARDRLEACGADQELITLTKACLASEAVDRPKDAQAVAEALTAYVDGVQERLHKAELAEAEARARAIEEVKRHRLTLALASTVLLALASGGGGWLWVKSERDARQVALTRDVNGALNKATALHERSKAASSGGAALLAQAREQAQRALALVENGLADAVLATQVRQLQTELDKDERDRTLVAALNHARLAQAESASDKKRFALEQAVPLYREAFRAYGLAAGEGDPTAAAARIRERPAPVREALLAALDEWDDLAGKPEARLNEPHREWLRAVLDAAEPENGWGRQVRAARRETDSAKRQSALEALAKSADVRKISAAPLIQLAWQLGPRQRAALLRRAQQQYPGDFWINQILGTLLRDMKPPELDDAVRFLTAAVALRPESPGCRINLGLALVAKGQLDEAIASYRKAIEIDPQLAMAHSNLGIALLDNGQTDLAIASFRKAIEIDPKDANAYDGLGDAASDKGQLDVAIASYRKAIEIRPMFSTAHNSLGFALLGQSQTDKAIKSFRKAIEIDPELAMAHGNLGIALMRAGRIDPAIASFRKAIEIDPQVTGTYGKLSTALRKVTEVDPNSALAHVNLGLALLAAGQIDVAAAEFREAIRLKPDSAVIHYYLGVALMSMDKLDEAVAAHRVAVRLDGKHAGDAIFALGEMLRRLGRYDEAIETLRQARDIARAEARPDQVRPEEVQRAESAIERVSHMNAFVAQLPALFRSESTSEDRTPGSTLAAMRYDTKRYAAAARLYAEAFRAKPSLAEDFRTWHRFNAAGYASLAAAAHAEEEAKLDDTERARLRKQALGWLRADVEAWTKLLENKQPAAGALVLATMKHWQQDSDLAGTRDKAALAKLPPDERAAFTQLWADVANLLKRAATCSAKDAKP
jgi:eukaryotic-like serine/threonine-protein kinase